MRNAMMMAALIIGSFGGGAEAMPVGQMPATHDVQFVQLRCTPASCIDPRTGVYPAFPKWRVV